MLTTETLLSLHELPPKTHWPFLQGGGASLPPFYCRDTAPQRPAALPPPPRSHGGGATHWSSGSLIGRRGT